MEWMTWMICPAYEFRNICSKRIVLCRFIHRMAVHYNFSKRLRFETSSPAVNRFFVSVPCRVSSFYGKFTHPDCLGNFPCKRRKKEGCCSRYSFLGCPWVLLPLADLIAGPACCWTLLLGFFADQNFFICLLFSDPFLLPWKINIIYVWSTPSEKKYPF